MTITEYANSRGITRVAAYRRFKKYKNEIKYKLVDTVINIDDSGVTFLDQKYPQNVDVFADRQLNISIARQNPSKSENSLNYRLIIPNEWAKKLGITKDSPQVNISYQGDQIIISKL